MVSADSVSLTDKKRTLRLEMTARRSRLGSSERSRAGAAAAARLSALPELSDAARRRAVVAGFVSTRDEIDPAPALAELRHLGAQVAYPRVGVGSPRMRFHVAEPGQLHPGRFGIREPEEGCREVSVADVAVVLVPGLAFDRAGHRLGFGGGYYDEWLAAALGVPGSRRIMGLGFDFQVVDECPAGDHDVPVDGIVTDLQTILCAPPARGGAAPSAKPADDEHVDDEDEEGS